MFGMVPSRRKSSNPKLFYSPFREMEDMANRMFGDFFADTSMERFAAPDFNMFRDEGDLVIEVSLPGYNKNDISIEVQDEVLTIRGKTKEEKKEEEKDYYYREFYAGSFERKVSLPERVKPEDFKAKYKNGILEIRMPSAEEPEEKVHTITIE